jgi:cytochrome c553
MMRSSHPLAIVLGLVVAGCIGQTAAAADPSNADDREAFFESRIRPVFVTTCFKCHGGEKTSNHLRVDRRESLIKGGDAGPAIIPGDTAKSLLLRALRYSDDDLKMPPEKKLPEAVIVDFERWIRDGAVWPASTTGPKGSFHHERHWAFSPVRRVEPPVDSSGWSANAVDCFLRAARAAHGVHPVSLADKSTLLRRASFDLTGLPPSPNEAAAFLTDDSPRAFPKLIERLLASPQYGERWGRYWMDVVRYADTAGDNADYPVPEAHLYRDYIIDSFNADKPYDQFVREQIAGDLLAKGGSREKYAERVVATGFLALSRRYATAPYELWHLTLEDSIDTVGRAYLGIALRCARCHDHKFDPVTTRDYYGLYGIFASTSYPYAGSEEFQSMKFGRRAFASLVPASAAAPVMAAYREELSGLRKRVENLDDKKRADKRRRSQIDRLEERLRVLQRRGTPEALPVAYAVSEGTPADVNIQLHGEPGQPGDKVPRGVPKFLGEFDSAPIAANESGRLQLANWIASLKNPLTARVLVNRVWQHHFGRGIVETPSNFGTRGIPPTHPELLDWLTTQFVEHGWSIKSLHRMLMTSKTYQLASTFDAANDRLDAPNHWYWRFDRQRLDAEATRDAMLFVGGTLDLGRPGPHPFPPIRDWSWTQHNPFKAAYSSRYRSVYLMTQRLHRHPFLGLFDGPDTNTTTDVRSSSTVPLQALFLMNSSFSHEAARAFATRLCREAGPPDARIRRAFELAYSRPPAKSEIDRVRNYLDRYTREAASAGLDSRHAEAEAWLSYARTILMSNEFVSID